MRGVGREDIGLREHAPIDALAGSHVVISTPRQKWTHEGVRAFVSTKMYEPIGDCAPQFLEAPTMARLSLALVSARRGRIGAGRRHRFPRSACLGARGRPIVAELRLSPSARLHELLARRLGQLADRPLARRAADKPRGIFAEARAGKLANAGLRGDAADILPERRAHAALGARATSAASPPRACARGGRPGGSRSTRAVRCSDIGLACDICKLPRMKTGAPMPRV